MPSQCAVTSSAAVAADVGKRLPEKIKALFTVRLEVTPPSLPEEHLEEPAEEPAEEPLEEPSQEPPEEQPEPYGASQPRLDKAWFVLPVFCLASAFLNLPSPSGR